MTVIRTLKAIVCWNALGTFFFDFVTVDNRRQCAFTGLDLVFGRSMACMGLFELEPNLWGILLLAVTVAALFCAMVHRCGKGISMLFSAMGIVILVLLQLSFVGKPAIETMQMAFGYWLCFGLFFVLGLLGFFEANGKDKRQNDATVHINIFTNGSRNPGRDMG
ncbi:hypothetical protein [Flavobacterium caeni]|uniref:Uncharacterized protein n=1 Tax=Flavobacterium caeni TaxID=490189 RepID=A0A1G5GWS8_9FLAO|nr:hypothetical protein [Flavobacterium caeni]SCY55944.1 hypothetical protein SAMN02927903_01659 [Flavobacterium caeni]